MPFAKATAIAALIALAPGQVRAQDRDLREGSRNSRAHSTRSKAPSIQRELIALLISGARRPAIRDEQWHETESALLNRLGRIHTRSAIRALVDLAAYELGTSGSEDLECLLLKESKRAKAAVLAELLKTKNSCLPTHSEEGVCKPIEAWLTDVKLLQSTVEQGKVCELF
ncbi:MAG TPA: hypothetical protein VN177_07480 [Myxococcales bacterium]|jgi:hypothetical protein|nr:hypothetical protein [Myxococcales bacterium]